MFLSLYTNIPPEQAFPVLSCQQQKPGWWGRPGNWSFHLCSWPSQVTVSKVLHVPVPGRNQLATRGTTEKFASMISTYWKWSCKLDSCSAHTHLLVRNSLVIKVKFFGLISKLVRIKEIVRLGLESTTCSITYIHFCQDAYASVKFQLILTLSKMEQDWP